MAEAKARCRWLRRSRSRDLVRSLFGDVRLKPADSSFKLAIRRLYVLVRLISAVDLCNPPGLDSCADGAPKPLRQIPPFCGLHRVPCGADGRTFGISR